ncbi:MULTISPECIES: hypothetical protein [Pyrobaculum]|uniref:hypothetical protein n=1 Tax=Pyrobaculum TaxID=2276 RepID=UPI0013E8B543|nr:hypothetical protein [Pyrobaculum arsenaticum]MCY0890236.1 hypothetical protein [Pyrobaculum arsenaticum]
MFEPAGAEVYHCHVYGDPNGFCKPGGELLGVKRRIYGVALLRQPDGDVDIPEGPSF